MFGWFRRKSRTIDEIAELLDEAGARRGGRHVSTQTALEVSTVLACVEVIASGVAVPELHVMRDLGDGQREKATDAPEYRLLNRRPNEFQTSFEFREMMTLHAALSGDAVAVPVRDVRNDQLSELLPVLPQNVQIERRNRDTILYRIHDEFGLIGEFDHTQVLHIRNRSWDGLRGLNSVKQAASAIGLSMAVEDNMSGLHENGGRPSGILSTESALSPDAVERLKDQFDRFSKASGRFKTAVLDNGFKYEAMAMTAEDAQALETRRFQIEEICRAFGVFPIMVGHADKTATYASAEAFFAANNRRTVLKWQRNWGERLDEFILDGAGPLYTKFDNGEVLSASLKDQGEFFARALGTGGSVPFMTVNEVRAERGLPPIQGGDELREPAASTLAPPETETEGG